MSATNNLFSPELRPVLRPIRVEPAGRPSEPMLLLADHQRIATDGALMVSAVAGYALMAADGTRNLHEIQAYVRQQLGVDIRLSSLRELFTALDASALLDNDNYRFMRQAAIRRFRAQPFREPSSAGAVYPADPDELAAYLDDFRARLPADLPQLGSVRGVLSPHIDYERGGSTYAHTWAMIADAMQDAELVITVGTDHNGGAPFTLTRQHYATPFGVLPTDQAAVDRIVAVLGEDAAFQDELNHIGEHSLELVLVWLHYFRRDNPPRVLPILTGSLYDHLLNGTGPSSDPQLQAVSAELRKLTEEQNAVIVASGDLAHVGPVFRTDDWHDDRLPELAALDSAMLDTIRAGDAAAWFDFLKQEHDARNVCGLAPVYVMMQALGQSTEGQVFAYQQCPADDDGKSWVSIAGAVLG